MSLDDYNRRVGATGSLIADPQFAAVQKMNPTKVGVFPPDFLGGSVDFADLFATHPEIVRRGMGLQPAAFADTIPNR